MRWTGGVFAAMVLVVGTTGAAPAGQPGCMNCNRTAANSPWAAEACAAPAGFTCTPGCCEERRPCCDNAWDGYCEHHARVQAFWACVGTSHRSNYQMPCQPYATASGTTSPTPRLAPTAPTTTPQSITSTRPSTTTKKSPSPSAKQLPSTEAPMPPALQAPLPPTLQSPLPAKPPMPVPPKPVPAKSASSKPQKVQNSPFVLGQW